MKKEQRPEFTDKDGWLGWPLQWKKLPSLETVKQIRQAIIWLLEDINSDMIKPDKGLAMSICLNALLNAGKRTWK